MKEYAEQWKDVHGSQGDRSEPDDHSPTIDGENDDDDEDDDESDDESEKSSDGEEEAVHVQVSDNEG